MVKPSNFMLPFPFPFFADVALQRGIGFGKQVGENVGEKIKEKGEQFATFVTEKARSVVVTVLVGGVIVLLIVIAFKKIID